MNDGYYIDIPCENMIIGIRIICDVEGCNDVADKCFFFGKIFEKIWSRMKNREVYERYGYCKIAMGLCKRHYEEIIKELSEG